MYNKTTLIGHLGKDPELIQTQNSKIGKFTIATSENYKDNTGQWITQTEWHNVTCFGYLAEKASKYTKGQLLFVEGKNTTKKYTDKEGKERYSFEIVASDIKLLEKKEFAGTQMNETLQPLGETENRIEQKNNSFVQQTDLPF